MPQDLNSFLIKKIQNTIAPNIKLAEFLVHELSISKQSAYRRIKGEIPFSFEQVSKLSLKLQFSMDEIVGSHNNDYSMFRLHTPAVINPEKLFLNMLEKYYELLQRQYRAKNSGTILIMNRIYYTSGIFFDYLFKFFYYKWMHQISDVPLDYNFSQVILPQEMMEILSKIKKFQSLVNNNTYIIDPNALSNSLSEIQYYYKRGLINEEEIQHIRNEIRTIIDITEDIVRKGILPETGSSFYYYISQLPIDANNLYFWYDDNIRSYFFVNQISTLNSNNQYACSLHKKWIDSLKKYSTLITHSNEMLQSQYFINQRKCLEEMLGK